MSQKMLGGCSARLSNMRACDSRVVVRWNRRTLYKVSGTFTRLSSSQASVEASTSDASSTPAYIVKSPLGQRAKQKQADKEFFADLLSSAATKRDVKAYLARLKNPAKSKPLPVVVKEKESSVNLGSLFARPRSVDESPQFAQHKIKEQGFEEQETLHIALVKIRDVGSMSDDVVQGIAQTLSQLARLSMAPCVVVESSDVGGSRARQELASQAERLASAIDSLSDLGARVVDNALMMSASGEPEIAMRKLLLRPLRSGQVPIVVPAAYSEQQQQVVALSASDVILTLTKEFSGQNSKRQARALQTNYPDVNQVDHGRVSLDRIILIDDAGGIPSASSRDGKHVFINLAQEYDMVTKQLSESRNKTASLHQSNLKLLQDALRMLPQTSSGLMAASDEAANLDQMDEMTSASMVGTRRQKNMLIYNLLTDKPAHSSSLPKTRLSKKHQDAPVTSVPTFVKRGMPVLVSPDPLITKWTADAPRIKLTDPSINLEKLTFLIDDSFNRKLDVDAYLKRVNEKIAGVIIAGDYEGGAILTWETPPGADPIDSSRLVPYLDKFAVLKRSQGSGGVADIVFNAMVRICFPEGVCWRSRKGNPVNKWYFERSSGTWKIPDMNWTMFWTTPGVATDSQQFKDYEGVCRGVIPTWIDKKMAAD